LPREGFIFPLSFAQQRLWFFEQLQPDTAVYNLPLAFRLCGLLNVNALEYAIGEVVRRHEALRTTFAVDQGQPVQVVAPTLALTVEHIDLSHLPEADRDSEARRVLVHESRRLFDLSGGPLLRVCLLQLAPEEHTLLIVVHHIVSDGWSIRILLRELSANYDACLKKKPPHLPALPIQYGDFTVCQREWFEQRGLKRQLSYWRENLKDAPALLALPTDYTRGATQTYRGARHSFTLPDRLSENLRTLSQREGATPFMTFLAAFKVLLYRYTAQSDIVVGAPIAGRNQSGLEGLIGFFVNTLVLRTALSGDLAFTDVLQRVRETALGAYANQDVPFEKLVEEQRPERNLSHSPLFQVLFQLRVIDEESLTLDGIEAERLELDTGIAKFDLALDIVERPEGFSCLFRYNADLFTDATARRIGEHFKLLLEAIAANRSKAIAEIPLLTPAEAKLAVPAPYAGSIERSQSRTIADAFEEQANRAPGDIAVTFENQSLTYGELNVRANRLAHRLISHGVKPEALVGIFVPRSLELVVGILGILKAGGAYVPLDSEYPKQRLAHVVGETKMQLLITSRAYGTRLPKFSGRVLYIEEDRASREEQATDPTRQVNPDYLAYVMYTSGSTGKPKGVLGFHRGVLNYFSYIKTTYQISGADTVLQLPSVAFDASIRDMLAPLTMGAKVVILNEFDAKEPAALISHIQKERVTCILSIVPTLLNAMMDAACSGDRWADSMRLILVSGEALTRAACQKFQELFHGKVALVNQYGPTECTMTSSYHKVDGEEVDWNIAPLGTAIPNARMYVLDKRLQLLASVAAGEIYVGGVGLTRGYLDSADLTAEKFVPDPFSAAPGARLYRTGDLGRYRADGTIAFLGRVDHQVKLRGYRVELGEIEAVLREYEPVEDAVVIASNDERGHNRLVAYIVSRTPADKDAEKTATFLKNRLPRYMVPDIFVFLDQLPLTPNRKVDRRRLPDPASLRKAQEIAPSRVAWSPVEEIIAGIWREVLGWEKFGVDENFFALGGHSLQAAQLAARLRQAFKVDFPLRQLFEAPTVTGIAEYIEMAQRSKPAVAVGAITPVLRPEGFPLSLTQRRLWFLEQMDPGSPVYNISAATRLTGPVDIAVLERSLNEIVRRHAVFRTSFLRMDGEPVQAVSSLLQLVMDFVDLQHLPENDRQAEAMSLAGKEAQRPFDLAQAPLLRVGLLRLTPDDHVLLVTMHHMIADGWSLEILYRELSRIYAAFSRNGRSPLDDLPIQYVDFAYWQYQWLQGAVLDLHLSYWKRQLKGAPTVLELPTDRPRPAIARFGGATQRLLLSESLMAPLEAMSRERGATPFMTLLAAFATLLYRYTGQDDLVLGALVANRNRAEVEPLIGYFASPLPLRVQLSGNPTMTELLARVRETALGAYEHEELPFERLVDELAPERSLSRNPLFQVAFSMQKSAATSLSLPGVVASPLAIDRGTSKFDLTLHLIEGGGGTRATIEYNTDLFDAATIERMLGHYHMLLQGIIANPNRRISEFPILTDMEEQQIICRWNDSARDYSEDPCIHQLIEAQVEKSPDAIAVVFEKTQLTYSELNRRANQLAQYLRRSGVGAEDAVAICVERSLELMVAVLAVLKAGAAYVPLDPAYPRERLSFMLADSRALVLLTQDNPIPGTEHANVVCLHREWQTFVAEPEDNLHSGVSADNPAYVIYTSGSTGKPKGVQITHRGLRNVFGSMREQPGMSDRDVFLAVATLSFDIAALELILPLTTGARVVIASREVTTDGAQLKKLLSQSGATIMQATPATWRLLVDAGWSGESDLRLQCGGEALSRELARQLVGKSSSLWNLYGPTETTIYSTAGRVLPEDAPVSIGRPIANTQIYLLDSRLAPVPVGIPAELYIGGDGLARGYVNQPDLTADKFIPNPFSREGGERLYRTGDIARYLPDGRIECLGRSDHQVKIRGFRIELGEVEAALAQYPEVRGAVVTAIESGGDKRLVAYVVPTNEKSVSIESLRRFLKAKLPDYMVPAVFSFLEAFPLTANGKIDRKALPPPDQSRPDLNGAFVAPRTATEKLLAKSWAEVLRLDRVGVHDNFFELGGHSLSAMELISKISAAMNRFLCLKLLFMHPTIAELATALDEVGPNGPRKNAPTAGARADSTEDRRRHLPTVEFERRPLLSLIASGKMPPVDSAALGYLSEETLARAGLTAETALLDWYGNMPTVSWILETSLGRIAVITLPRLGSELYKDQDDLVKVIVEALEISRQIGAKAVSLMGLLPSATDYGRAVAKAVLKRDGLPVITTGHGTTVSAMVLTMEKVLALAGRKLTEETVVFLGLGSIGTATLRLMLRCLPHPRRILLCDLYGKVTRLQELSEEITRDACYGGVVEIVPSSHPLPARVYDATLIVGATNVPDLLHVESLKPGTLIVDDSAPHCFEPQALIQRLQSSQDILFSAGGAVQPVEPVRRIRYLPRHIEQMMLPEAARVISNRDAHRLAGCAFSSLLLSRFRELPPSVGLVDVASSVQHYKLLTQLGHQAAELHCEDYLLPESLIGAFRQRFGRHESMFPNASAIVNVNGKAD
jgi:amino acid adenylation domain-containing protein